MGDRLWAGKLSQYVMYRMGIV